MIFEIIDNMKQIHDIVILDYPITSRRIATFLKNLDLNVYISSFIVEGYDSQATKPHMTLRNAIDEVMREKAA